MNCAKHIVLTRGADWLDSWAAVDDAGAAIDLTGSVVTMELRQYLTDAAAALTLSSPASGVTVNASSGYVDFRITPEQVDALPWTAGVYAVKVLTPDLVTLVWHGGRVHVKDW